MNLIKDLKSFASKVEEEFVKLFKEAPSIMQIASGVISYGAPIVQTLVTLTAGAPAGTATANILAQIKADLATASAAVQSVDGAKTLPTVLASLQQQLPALLTAAKVENLANVTEIETVVNTFIAEVDAVYSALTATSGTAAA